MEAKKNQNVNKGSASNPVGIKKERLYLPALSEPVETDLEERILKVTITTRDRDREGDVVEPSGLDFDNYLKNPVVLWAHDTTIHPLGRVCEISVFDDRVDAKVQFADTEQGRECFMLYRSRYLNAWSIGFIPKKWDLLKNNSEDGREGLHITEAEVVELSAVPIPANPKALTRDLESGAIKLSGKMQKALDVDELEEIKNYDRTSEDSANTEEIEAVVKSPESDAIEESESGNNDDIASAGIPLRKALTVARSKTLEIIRKELRDAIALAKGELC